MKQGLMEDGRISIDFAIRICGAATHPGRSGLQESPVDDQDTGTGQRSLIDT